MNYEEQLEKLKKGTIECLINMNNSFKTTEGNDDEYFNNLIKLIDEFKCAKENNDIYVIEIFI